jgi:hypothetical protein
MSHWQLDGGPPEGHRIPRPERRGQGHHHAADPRTGPPDRGHGHHRRPGYRELKDPLRTVGALLRHSAGAVAVLLLWPLLVEPTLGNLPGIGSGVGPYLPFANVFRFIDVQWLYYATLWGEVGSLLYFVAVVAMVYAVAVVVVNRLDA